MLLNQQAWLATWLASRKNLSTDATVIISAPDSVRPLGIADLKLEKFQAHHQDGILFCFDNVTSKPKSWTELGHLVAWSSEFLTALETNKQGLAVLELLRGTNSEYPISVANFHVEEAINVVQSAISFELGLDMQHPDTRGQNYGLENVLIEDSINLHDIIRQVFTCLFSKCAVNLVVKSNQFFSAALTAYIVDLMYESGATNSEVKCIAFERRDSIGNERFIKCLGANRSSKLSTIAAVFKQTDTFAAAQGIIESYFREQYQNLIVLVEESAYERFVKDWQRYYSHAIHIGSRYDSRTTVVDTLNSKVQIDLSAIDIKASHKMSGHVINVLKFRTLSELCSLLGNLRKVPYMSVWNDDVLLSREFCLRMSLCNEFWLNHVPRSLSGRKFPYDMLNYYSDKAAEDMTNIYNSVNAQFADELEQLKRLQTTFTKKDSRLKTMLILQAFTSLVTKSKSLKNGASVTEALNRLKRFQLGSLQRISTLEPEDSRIETVMKPVGIAIFLVREESQVKSKAVLVEFIFKNLLLGNAVLVVCPANTLGVKFSFENDHVIPFKMVHESMPDISRLSLDNSIEENESVVKKQCPKNTYAIEILPEMNSETCEAMTIALGSRATSIWYPNAEQAKYW